jgi:hypothetical protein
LGEGVSTGISASDRSKTILALMDPNTKPADFMRPGHIFPLRAKGRSLGKLITGTKVIKTDGSELSYTDLLKRNFIRAVPFDQLSFMGSKGWHDNFSDTAVVRKNNFEKAKSLESDLEMIGVKENL